MTEQSQPNPKCRNLVLDAGPILSLSPLRGLASTYYTTPQVLAELKDSRAREHFEKLGLMSGVNVAVKSPDATSLANVIQWAKKTGDYSVLSHADLCVIALTYMLNEEYKREVEKEAKEKEAEKETEAGSPVQPEQNESAPISEDLTQQVENLTINVSTDSKPVVGQPSTGKEDSTTVPTENDEPVDSEQLEPLQVELHPVKDEESSSPRPTNELIPDTSAGPDSDTPSRPQQLYDDPSDEDDGKGEWITPQNVGIHKSRALDFLPDDEAPGKKKGKGKAEEPKEIGAGCMTADFAMQNVLLQMGLDLVSVDGKRIQKFKNYVLRCHACFKICKDHSKKFCPSCGNPSLLRATVTISAPSAAKDAPVLQVHLKPNFQYRIRGTKYSIPASKPGSAKTGTGEGLILREDQTEWMRAKKRADGKRERDEARMLKGMLNRGVEGANGGVSSWMDPDWVPEILSVGSGGKGRTVRNSRMDGDMPIIGFGKKNPNERKKRK